MKSKPQQLTYTLAPASARSSTQNNHDQISPVASSKQSRAVISSQPDLRLLRTKVPMEEAILQLSDLNTSGANTTICEYVKILGDNNNRHYGDEAMSSLHSSWSEDYRAKIETIRRNNEARVGRRDGFDHLMDLQRFKKKGNNTYKSSERYQTSGSKPLATAPGRDDSATVIEFTDFIGYTEGNPVEKENVPEVKREKLVVGKIAIPPKTRLQETKNSFQQSMISKIAGGSSHQNISSSTSASITARRLREEHHVNRSQGVEAATLSSRLMNSRTERENYQTQPTQPAQPSSSLIKPLIQLTASPQLNIKKSKKRMEAGYKSALSHRNSQSSNISSLQNPIKSTQKKFNPVPAPVSRSVQAIVTPRGHYFIQNDESQKSLAPIKEEPNKMIENKRAQSKGEIKSSSKKDSSKGMKSTKIDLIEMDISKKSGQRRRNEKVEECAESLEVVYGILRKAMKDKKEEISHSEHCIQRLEGLKNFMIETISNINGLKLD